jgi:D-arabinose 1-dehydrogenase-like Zn-dependent alcohol dehydrogenase
MRATVMHAAEDVRVEDVADARIEEPTDAVLRITRACICGSDLWPYKSLDPSEGARIMGHEAIGVVEDIGSEVGAVQTGDLVVMPFASSDGTCVFCHEGLQTNCVHRSFFGNGQDGIGGAQAEALRIPWADGTLYPLPSDPDEALMPSLLTLADVLGTGHHAALVAGVEAGKSVAAPTRSSSASAATSRPRPRSKSPGRVAPSAASAYPRASSCPEAKPPSTATSRSPAAPRQSGPTSTSCYPTSSRGRSVRAASSTGP